jgi:hypothetical protein
MKCKFTLLLMFFGNLFVAFGQLNPGITSWLINTTGATGSHYVQGNSTPIVDATLANVQMVQYSANWAYVTTTGVPSYITGPFWMEIHP